MTNSKLLFSELMHHLILEVDTSEKEAILFWVMEHYYHLSRTDIMAGKEIAINKELVEKVIARLNNNEPVQYILGETGFYGRTFRVSPSVLIPRPETEIIVDFGKSYLKGFKKDASLIDLGTGSGCIAITMALEVPLLTVHATDISDDSLEVAKENAKRLNAIVNFHSHDVLNDPLSFGLFDIIVSNPPYVMERERATMQKNVTDYEPRIALFVPDSDPLVFHRAIAIKGKSSLKPGGFLITEINEKLAKETVVLFESLGYIEVSIIKDLNGKDRFVSGQLH